MNRSSHIKRIAHITIGVSDLKKSVSFFQDVLGLEKMGDGPLMRFLISLEYRLAWSQKQKWKFVCLLMTLTKPIEILRMKEPNLLPSQRINLGVFETQLSSTLTETPSSSSRSNVKSAANFVRVIASFLKST